MTFLNVLIIFEECRNSSQRLKPSGFPCETNMKINQALKNKARLAGEIVRLQAILTRENARRSDSASKVDREQTWYTILKISEELAALKGKITVANIGIYPRLEQMAELKSQIAYISGLPKRSGTEIEPAYGNNERITYTWDSFITQEKSDELIHVAQDKLNLLQDECDAYNASTSID